MAALRLWRNLIMIFRKLEENANYRNESDGDWRWGFRFGIFGVLLAVLT